MKKKSYRHAPENGHFKGNQLRRSFYIHRDLSEAEESAVAPLKAKFESLHRELTELGCTVDWTIYKKIEVPPNQITDHEGHCPHCFGPLNQVTWDDAWQGSNLMFVGLVCMKCNRVLEHAGFGELPNGLFGQGGGK